MASTLAERILAMDPPQWQAFERQQPFPAAADEAGQAVLRRFAREHLDNAGPSNRWFTFLDFKVYLRLSRRALPGERGGARMIDLADVEVSPAERGKGVFSRFLRAAEVEAARLGFGVYVESILNPVLRDALERRGYRIDAKDPGFEIWDAILSPAEIAQRSA